MKKKILLLSGIAALTFAACTNDGDGLTQVPAPGKPVVEEGIPTYATISVKGEGGAVSRAMPESSDDKDEVNSTVVLLFNSASKVLEKKVELTGTDTESTFLTTSGTKRIVALANLTTEMTAKMGALVEKTSTLDEVLAMKVESGISDVLIPTGAALPMSTANKDQMYVLKPAIEEGNASTDNGISLEVQRMVAKVKLNVVVSGNNLIDTKFSIGNIAKETYYVQSAIGDLVKSPLYIWDTTWAWADKFMTKEAENNELNKYYYLVENTSASFTKQTATHLILKGQYVPAQLVDRVSFNVGTQTLEYTYKTGTKDNSGAFCYISTSSIPTIIPQGLYFENKAALEAAITLYNSKNTGTTITLDNLTQKSYTDKSYYRVNIGEGDTADATEYGVKRNKQYNVTVTNVTGPGYSTKDEAEVGGDTGKPTDPIDQKTYLNVKITVAPWVDANQGGVEIN